MPGFFEERSEVDFLSKVTLGVLGVAANVVGVVSFFADRLVFGITAMFICCIVAIAYAWYLRGQISYIGFFADDPDRLVRRAAALLRKSRRSLYYYGAVGLINTENNHEWQDALEEKLKQPRFKVVRMVDLQDFSQFSHTYERNLPQLKYTAQQYRKWIGVHRGRFGYRDEQYRASNEFYNFAGAPIWQRGFHLIVFDEKHLLLVYRKADDHARGLLLLNRPAACRDIVDTMNSIKQDLKLDKTSGEELDVLFEQLGHYLRTENIEESSSTLPFHRSKPVQPASVE